MCWGEYNYQIDTSMFSRDGKLQFVYAMFVLFIMKTDVIDKLNSSLCKKIGFIVTIKTTFYS